MQLPFAWSCQVLPAYLAQPVMTWRSLAYHVIVFFLEASLLLLDRGLDQGLDLAILCYLPASSF